MTSVSLVSSPTLLATQERVSLSPDLVGSNSTISPPNTNTNTNTYIDTDTDTITNTNTNDTKNEIERKENFGNEGIGGKGTKGEPSLNEWMGMMKKTKLRPVIPNAHKGSNASSPSLPSLSKFKARVPRREGEAGERTGGTGADGGGLAEILELRKRLKPTGTIRSTSITIPSGAQSEKSGGSVGSTLSSIEDDRNKTELMATTDLVVKGEKEKEKEKEVKQDTAQTEEKGDKLKEEAMLKTTDNQVES